MIDLGGITLFFYMIRPFRGLDIIEEVRLLPLVTVALIRLSCMLIFSLLGVLTFHYADADAECFV